MPKKKTALTSGFLNYLKLFTLDLQIIDRGGVHLIVGFHSAGAVAAFRIVDLQVDSGVVFRANNLQESSDRLSGLALASDDVAHIGRIDFESQENSHLVHGSVNFDFVRAADNRLHDHL